MSGMFFDPFDGGNSGGGGGGSTDNYSIKKQTNQSTGEVSYRLTKNGTSVGDIIGFNGNQILVSYGGETVLLNTAIEDIEEALSNTYVLPIATSSTLGGVKIGNNINIANDGTISVDKTIVSVELTNTSGLEKTYTITYNDGTVYDFVVTDGADGTNGTDGTNGVGIASITKTHTSGLEDTYTIRYTNGATSTFIVTNGRDGIDGINGTDGNGIVSITKTSTSGLVDTYTITYTNGTTTTFTVTNGASYDDTALSNRVTALEQQVGDISTILASVVEVN